MKPQRFVVLGLARVRAPWFSATSNWANSAAVPVEFVKCVSAAEVRARLGGGRAVSAVLVDEAAQGVDRDLIDAARSSGAAVVVVADGRAGRDWISLGAAAVLHPQFDRAELLACLETYAEPIRSATPLTAAAVVDSTFPAGAETWAAPLVAVTGTPGSGSSTVAMAVAQGLAGRPANRGAVVLADLRLRGDQTMYHHTGDVVPGLSELVDAHRRGSPEPTRVRAMCWSIEDRGYELLLGLRRPRDWTTLRLRAFDAALNSLRNAYRAVVTDVDPDLEGEAQTGSVDVEERNMMARVVTSAADLNIVVTAPTLVGLHGAVRLQAELIDHGVDPSALLTVVNRVRRSPRVRAELTSVLHALGAAPTMSSPVFLPDRHRVESIHRAGGRLPVSIEAPLAAAVARAIEHQPPSGSSGDLAAVGPAHDERRVS